MSIKTKIKNLLPQSIVTAYKKRKITSDINYLEVKEPVIYNKNGQPIRTFFLCDINCGLDESFTAGQQPLYIQWDRARYNLPIHFYSD